MTSAKFPPFVKSLPEAELPFAGLRGWLLRGDSGLAMFLEADVDVTVTEHSHGDQWGVVIAGKIDLTIGGVAHALTRGDTYLIPAGTRHSAKIHAGFQAIDYFAERDRYRVKQA